MTGQPHETAALEPDERAELEGLRAEVARLRATPTGGRADRPGGRQRGRQWGRVAAAVVLIALSCLLAPLSVVAVWARSEVTDTNRYVATVAPLADDPAVQEAITADITNTVFRYVDVQSLIQQAFAALAEKGALPPSLASRLEGLAVPVANGVRAFTQDQVRKVVQSDLFARAWLEANRSAHQQLVAALSGETSGGVVVEGNAVKVNLAAFLDVVKQRLVASGFELANRIPEVNATFTVFESADVSKVQRGFTLLDKLGFWLPVVVVVLAAGGIYAAPNHRIAFVATGIGIALAMLATGAALQAVRRAYLDGVPQDVLPIAAAASLYDTVARFLRDAVRAAFLLGLVVAAGAFLTGPSVTAVTVRRWLVAGFAALKGGAARLGMRLAGATRWVAPRARMLRVLVVACAFVLLLLQRYRTPGLVGWLTAGVLVGLAAVQFLATSPAPVPPKRPGSEWRSG